MLKDRRAPMVTPMMTTGSLHLKILLRGLKDNNIVSVQMKWSGSMKSWRLKLGRCQDHCKGLL
eukprot:12409139-Karenia_brevis.AAC.1